MEDRKSSDFITWPFCWCRLVTKSCLTLCKPVDCSPPGSSVHGVSQARRILEWVAIPFPRGSFWPRDWTHIPCIDRWILYHWATREAPPESLERFSYWSSNILCSCDLSETPHSKASLRRGVWHPPRLPLTPGFKFPSGSKKSYHMFFPPGLMALITSRQKKGRSQVKWNSLSRVWLFVTPQTIQSMEFSRPKYWSE